MFYLRCYSDVEGWDTVIHHLQQSSDHLGKVDSPTLVSWLESSDLLLQQYARSFDLSRSDPTKVRNPL